MACDPLGVGFEAPRNGPRCFEVGVVLERSSAQTLSPEVSPFADALKVASHVVVVPNSTVAVYTRLWCAASPKYPLPTSTDDPGPETSTLEP